MNKLLCMWTASAVIAAPSAVAELQIDRLVPKNSVILLNVSNAQKSIDRIKRTGIWGYWQSESMRKVRTKLLEDMEEALDELYEEFDIDEDALVLPDGAVGLALFPVVEEDLSQSMGFLLVADYGENAAQMNRLVDAALEKAEEDGELEFDTDVLLGRDVLSIEVSQLHGDQEDAEVIRDPFDDMEPVAEAPDVEAPFEKIHFVRDDNRFILASHLEPLGGCLEAIDDGDGTGVTERSDFRGVMRQLGTTEAWGVVLADGLVNMISEGDPMAGMFEHMFRGIVGDIRGIGFGVRLDTPTAMVENLMTLYMPNGRSGVLSLFDTTSPRGRVPSFVGPQVFSYTSANVEFSGIMEVIRSVAQTNPMLQQQIDMFMSDYGDDIRTVSSALGPEVHAVSVLKKPISLDSVKSVTAIRCRQLAEVEQILVKYAGPVLEARDFLGHRIYTLPFPVLPIGGPMMMSGGEGTSFGFGGGYVFIGTTGQVEDCLRAAGGADVPTIESNPAFRRAMRVLPDGDFVAWGVTDIAEYVEYIKNLDVLAHEATLAQMRQWNPELAEEMERDFREQPEPPWRNLDADALRRFIGPSSWECRVNEDGFVVSSSLLPAQPE